MEVKRIKNLQVVSISASIHRCKSFAEYLINFCNSLLATMFNIVKLIIINFLNFEIITLTLGVGTKYM